MGSMVRARWSALLRGTPRLHAAFSLESVADEIIFVVGPAVVTVLATAVYPAAGVGSAMLFCLAGTLLFTGGSAWFTGEARHRGELEPGMLADFAVLSGDYFSVPEEEMAGLESVLTVVGGKVVYQADTM